MIDRAFTVHRSGGHRVRCPNCGGTVVDTAKFCSACGKPMPESQGRDASAIDMPWLTAILKDAQYTVTDEQAKPGGDESCFCKTPGGWGAAVWLRKSPLMLCTVSTWKGHGKVSLATASRLMAACAAANLRFIVTCYMFDADGDLVVRASLPLLGRLSGSDVVRFLELVESEEHETTRMPEMAQWLS